MTDIRLHPEVERLKLRGLVGIVSTERYMPPLLKELPQA